MKTTVHIVSHSHWDREWYLPFEKHRMHLVELVDAILEKFETDEEYRSFFLDGQTIALDDYLEIRPQKREQIEKYVREGRLCVGPWYVLHLLSPCRIFLRCLEAADSCAAFQATRR